MCGGTVRIQDCLSLRNGFPFPLRRECDVKNFTIRLVDPICVDIVCLLHMCGILHAGSFRIT